MGLWVSKLIKSEKTVVTEAKKVALINIFHCVYLYDYTTYRISPANECLLIFSTQVN